MTDDWDEETLRDRVRELEDGIRQLRSTPADDRCIEDDDRLFALLHDGITCDRRVGSKAEMLRNCERYVSRRCEEGGPWVSYRELLEIAESLYAALQNEHSYPCPSAFAPCDFREIVETVGPQLRAMRKALEKR